LGLPVAPAAVPQAAPSDNYPYQGPGVQGTRGVLLPVDAFPEPSNPPPYSRKILENLLASDESLTDVQTWCSLQFADDQLSRARAYRDTQASFDITWTQQQAVVDETVKLIAVLFEKLVQELEERSRIWGQVEQTDSLSREAIEGAFLRKATSFIDEAVRELRAAMEDYSSRVLLAIRRAEDLYGHPNLNVYQLGHGHVPSGLTGSSMPLPANVFVSCICVHGDTLLIQVLCRVLSPCSRYHDLAHLCQSLLLRTRSKSLSERLGWWNKTTALSSLPRKLSVSKIASAASSVGNSYSTRRSRSGARYSRHNCRRSEQSSAARSRYSSESAENKCGGCANYCREGSTRQVAMQRTLSMTGYANVAPWSSR